MDVEQLTKDAMDGSLSAEQLVQIIGFLQQQNLKLQQQTSELLQRVEELEKQLGIKQEQEPDRYSLQEQERQENAKQKRRKEQKSIRRGRRKTKDKIVDTIREEKLFPEGLAEADCEFYRTQLVWHIEAGQAVLVSYRMHRGPGGETPVIDGTIGRSEFGVEIFVAVGFLTYVAGM